jgi:peptidoglycan hydrolase CwlO-like protein
MFETSLNNIYYGIGLTGIGLISLIITWQKVMKEWAGTKIENSVLELLHSELQRVNTQNTNLSIEISKLHVEIINLSSQLRKLTLENQSLQLEVMTLTSEIGNFKQMAGRHAQWQD